MRVFLKIRNFENFKVLVLFIKINVVLGMEIFLFLVFVLRGNFVL